MRNEVTYTIRKNEFGEYHVRFRLNGVRCADWDYFTNDKEEAEATALETVKSHNEAFGI
jgi:uncharacterized protein YegP (UPF0339 family)